MTKASDIFEGENGSLKKAYDNAINPMEENKCNCYHILGRPKERVILHLTGCEEDYQTKEYDSLKWYQKIFRQNPRKLLF